MSKVILGKSNYPNSNKYILNCPKFFNNSKKL